MTAKTVSETIFENLCAQLGIRCAPVPRGVEKTPDYDIGVCGNRVVAELKQLDQNDNDSAVFETALRTGSASGFSGADNRVRRKINEANRQLKARSAGCLPTMVVLYDNGIFGGIDSIDIKTAMFGDEKVVVTLVDREVLNVTPIHAGGGRRMTETCNTTISAVALLCGSIDEASLVLFHNHFAAVSIDPTWFRYDRVRQFSLASDCYEWMEL